MSEPTYGARGFTCPECGKDAQQSWQQLYVSDGDDQWKSSPFDLSKCYACQRCAVWEKFRTNYHDGPGWTSMGGGRLLWPIRDFAGPEPSPDMPDAVCAIYDEARSVASRSPRSASALLRLGLEALLLQVDPGARDLNGAIAAAAEDGLPRKIIDAMDVLRFSGNASIHELQRADTAETAAALLRLLNLVVAHLITEPREIRELHDALPDGVRGSIQRRDGLTEP